MTRSGNPAENVLTTPYQILSQYGGIKSLYCTNWNTPWSAESNSKNKFLSRLSPDRSQISSVAYISDMMSIDTWTAANQSCYVTPPITADIDIDKVSQLYSSSCRCA